MTRHHLTHKTPRMTSEYARYITYAIVEILEIQPFGMENFARPACHETMPVAAARWLPSPSSARCTHARPSLRNHDPLPTAHAITISISLSLTQSTNFLSVPLLCRPFLPTRSSLSLPQAALSLPPSSAWRPVAPAESDRHTRTPVPKEHTTATGRGEHHDTTRILTSSPASSKYIIKRNNQANNNTCVRPPGARLHSRYRTCACRSLAHSRPPPPAALNVTALL